MFRTQPTDEFILTAFKALSQADGTAANPDVGFRDFFQAEDTQDDASEGYFKQVSVDEGVCAPTSHLRKLGTCFQCCSLYSLQ